MSLKHPKTIVVPIDFSDESMSAIDTALDLVEEAAGVHVIHVLPSLSPVEIGVAWEMVDDETRIRETIHSLRQRLADSRFRDVRLNCFVGDPGHEITQEAEKVKADLIVMPSHGRRGLKRLLLGSVADRVVRLALCPVLILKAIEHSS